MAITVVGTGVVGVTPNSATTPMSATGMTVPTGVLTNDLMLMFVFFDTGVTTTGQSISVPTGWTFVASVGNYALTGGGLNLTVFGRIATASESDPPSPVFTGATTGTTNG